MVDDGARGYGLRVQGRLKTDAPPFLMLGLNVENTTTSDFRITAAARYLAFDTVGSGSELRVDGAVGSDPAFGVELYRPIGSTPFFVAPYAGVGRMTFNLVDNDGDAVVARYRRTRIRVGLNVGVNLGQRSDVRAGAYVGRTTASITVGDPGLPELRGTETGAEMVWRLNTQDSLVVPSHGVQSEVRLSHIFDGPNVVVQDRTFDVESSLTQLSADANQFWSAGPRQSCVCVWRCRYFVRSHPVSNRSVRLGHAVSARRVQGWRAEGQPLLRRDRRIPQASGSSARLHRRTRVRRSMARERRRLRRLAARRIPIERRRRCRVGHAVRTGYPRRFVELRRTMAHVLRCGTPLPLISAGARSVA